MNSSAVIVPWVNIWITAPWMPIVVSAASPRITYPMWLIDELAIIFFRSPLIWASATIAP